MMLDDTRCGLDASSLHRTTSMDISLSKKFRLLSCHRDTSSNYAFNRSIQSFNLKHDGRFKMFRLSPLVDVLTLYPVFVYLSTKLTVTTMSLS